MIDRGKISNAFRVILQGMLYLWLLVGIVINIQWAFRNDDPRDYGSFYASGKAFLEGKNPYLSSYPEIFVVEVNGEKVSSPNLNPPASLYLTALFAEMDLHEGYSVWRIVNIILYLVGVVILVLAMKITSAWKWMLLSLSVSGLWHIVELGQIYVPVFLLLILMWVALQKKKPILSGVFLGMAIAIKPNFALLLFALFLVKEWRLVISAISSGLLLTLIPMFDRGIGIYAQWWQAQTGYSGSWIPGNSSLPGFFARLGLPLPGIIIAILTAVVIFFLIIRYRWPAVRAIDAGLLLSILCSPIAWPGYSIFAIPTLFRMKNHPGISWVLFILGLPIVLIYWLSVPGTILYPVMGSWYGIAWILLLIWTVLKPTFSTGGDTTNQIAGVL